MAAARPGRAGELSDRLRSAPRGQVRGRTIGAAARLLDAAAGDGLTRLDLLLIFTFVALEELISIHAASNTHVHEGEG